MKYYPELRELPATREMIDVFRGYNHNLRIGDGEFYDMKNLSSVNYPVLSPRPKRGVYASPAALGGMIGKDTLCYVDGSDFVINEKRIKMRLSAEGIPKTLISMGAYVIIMPDKKYINTSEPSDFGSIEAVFTTYEPVEFLLCTLEGADIEYVVATTPQQLQNFIQFGTHEYVIDATKTPPVLKQWSTSTKNLESVATTYIKIKSAGIGSLFEVYDGVKIDGIENEALADLNSVSPIWAKGDDYIVVTGVPTVVTTQEAPITLTRQMPTMDFIIEAENRLWGCRYGQALNGEMVNEIYASKLGDFKNWNSFMGVSTDSYAVTVGTDGPFTGAIAFRGAPLFFKENCMHKVLGNYPANYQVLTTACRGVQSGCSRSLAIVNEDLFYKSRTAVCAYDGSLPYEISAPLGEIAYSKATAGALGNKYYISMSDTSGEYHLFVYDTLKGMWHREDNTQALDFCNYRGDLYYIDAETRQIKSVLGSGTPDKVPVKWMAETGIIGTDSPDKKYISRLDVRMYLDMGARAFFYIQYDSCGSWEHIYTAKGEDHLRSFAVPIRPKRCDHLRLRIEGEGNANIYSICKTIEQGSDI
jgi:hypothetical protein